MQESLNSSDNDLEDSGNDFIAGDIPPPIKKLKITKPSCMGAGLSSELGGEEHSSDDS